MVPLSRDLRYVEGVSHAVIGRGGGSRKKE